MSNSNKKTFPVKHWQMISFLLVLFDIFAVNAAYAGALWLRFDLRFSAIPHHYLTAFLRISPWYTVVCIIVFWLFRMYNSMWRFASYQELLHSIQSNLVTFVCQIALSLTVARRMPISYYLFGAVLQAAMTLGIRFCYRFVLLLRTRNSRANFTHRVLLIGAGSAGQMIIRDVVNGREDREDKICCIIDDNPNKWGRYIDNIPIYGGRDHIFEAVKKYGIDRIFFAIPSANAQTRRDILQICNETGCEVKQLPGLYQFALGDITLNSLREVPIEDLLGREPIRADMTQVFNFISGKTVLITGGGGSIGSELCRQVAAHDPKALIIFDIYENNAYDIQLELRDKYPQLNLITLIGSVRDIRRLDDVFSRYKPDIVYHAAAHKHVPLMEDSPCESIKNNVIGTYKTCYVAMRHGVQRFVLISTDKAVNPTNVMGASKRLCEMVVQTFDHYCSEGKAYLLPEIYTHDGGPMEPLDPGFRPCTRFVAVRFGNVLGSNGSVVPIFRRQIAKGGPVTVTHPDIIRYFMTVPEAVSLVMLAGTYAKGGEIFVLDMGSPVKIDTLARNLILLSGLKPDEDIRIEYTGLRPGEKLYEEKLMAEEGLEKTDNDLIHIGKPIVFSYEDFLTSLIDLKNCAYANDEKHIREEIRKVVTTYHEAGETGRDTRNAVWYELYRDGGRQKS